MADAIDKKDQEVVAVFQRLRNVEVEPPPYLETRVFAQWRERQVGLRKFRFWRNAAVASSVLSVALALIILSQIKKPEFIAFTQKPFVVRVSVADLETARLSRAEILLPEGVYFDIEQFPELRTEKKLSLKWSSQKSSELVPFVLNSTQSGVKKVLVRFFDESDSLVGVKEIVVELKEAT